MVKPSFLAGLLILSIKSNVLKKSPCCALFIETCSFLLE